MIKKKAAKKVLVVSLLMALMVANALIVSGVEGEDAINVTVTVTVTGPANANIGDSFQICLTAVDENGSTVSDYDGIIMIGATDCEGEIQDPDDGTWYPLYDLCILTPTPTPGPTLTPNLTPTPTATPATNVTPTPMPTPTLTESPSPTPGPTPTPSSTPTPTPTLTPTPTPSPSDTELSTMLSAASLSLSLIPVVSGNMNSAEAYTYKFKGATDNGTKCFNVTLNTAGTQVICVAGENEFGEITQLGEIKVAVAKYLKDAVAFKAEVIPPINFHVSPGEIDFGKVGVGGPCSEPQPLTFYNQGSKDLIIRCDAAGELFSESVWISEDEEREFWKDWEFYLPANTETFHNEAHVNVLLCIPGNFGGAGGFEEEYTTFWAEVA